jgi:hypothetical protein
MILNKICLWFTLLFVASVLMINTGCTKKDNLTGNNWSNVKPITVIDTSFVMGYSYNNEGKVKGTETTLLCGNEDEIEAVTILRFTDFPDTMTVTGQPLLKLVATRRSPLVRNPLILSFYKVNVNWAADSTSLITDGNMTALSIANFTVQDTILTTGDTLSIPIPIEVIQNWKTTNVTGFNLALKASANSWLEFKALESSNGPLLVFSYTTPTVTTSTEYSKRTAKDSYRITGTQTPLINNSWKLKNLLPQRMFVRFGMPNSLFKDADNNQLSSTDIRRMTVNKAELVMYVKNNPYFNATSKCYVYPYHVRRDTLTTPAALVNDDLTAVTHSYSSVKPITGDSIVVDITAITQAYTSGDLAKNGIVIKSIYEMLNYGNIEFWHYNDAPIAKKPYVKITYTTPYLKGD